MIEVYFTENENVYEKLKNILSRLLPSPFKILKTENGKPYLEGNPLFFSLSHSKDKAVIAVCNKPVGIDMEVASDRKFKAVLSRFPEKEQKEISGTEDFLKHWVVREAYIKMLGATLAEKLSALSFTDGVLSENGIVPDCELVCGSKEGLVYCICIDKRPTRLV